MKYVYTVYVRREICRACGPDAFKVQIENHLANLPSPFRPVLINSGLRGAEYVGLRGIRGSVDGTLARASVRREREKKKEGREKRDIGRQRWKIFRRVVDGIVFVSRSIGPHVRLLFTVLFLEKTSRFFTREFPVQIITSKYDDKDT